MEQMLYRIGEASAQLGLQDKNSNTLRSWVEEFKEYLGASANPEPGRPRFFTEDDMRVLRTVRDLRVNHLPYSDIKGRLAQGTHSVEQQDPEPDEQPDRNIGLEAATSLIVGDQLQALLAPLTRAADEWQGLAEQYRSRLEDRESRVTVLEQRIDTLQTRLEELYSQSLKQQGTAAAQAGTTNGVQAPRPAPRKRRWPFNF
jgi:DNA-binding transcriptional MerR regulator